MQKPDRPDDEPEESQRSRSSSRRSSISLPQNSLKKEKDKKSPLNTPVFHSAHSTPKRSARPSLDFIVMGKQILKTADRANSLPGSNRRPSSEPATISLPRTTKISERVDESQASREHSLDDDLSLDLSQISDFDGNLKHGKLPLATSTPKSSEVSLKSTPTPSEVGLKSTPTPSEVSLKSTPMPNEVDLKSTNMPPSGPKPRSASLQYIQQRVERRTTNQQSVDSSRRSQRSVDLPSGRSQQSADLPSGRSQQSADLSSGRSQQSADLSSGRSQQSADLSSGISQQSVDLSAKPSRDSTFSCSRDSLYKTSSSASPYRYGTDYSSVSPEYSPSSTELSPRADPSPSPLLSSWAEHTVEGGGEWSSFWANYNNCPLPLPRPLSYDQCPTPYREHLDHTDFESGSRSRVRSPEGIKHISDIIRSEGLRLTPRDAARVLQCAHVLGAVLSRAVDTHAHACPRDKKTTLTLNLKSTTPAPPKTSEMTTQTDISLPNTRSAPLIFERILRQLSRSSIDVPEPEKPVPKDETKNESSTS